jgi:hypothetical protein
MGKIVVLYTLTVFFLDSKHDGMIAGTFIKVKYFKLSDSCVLQ